jgi:hypothetical protein
VDKVEKLMATSVLMANRFTQNGNTGASGKRRRATEKKSNRKGKLEKLCELAVVYTFE